MRSMAMPSRSHQTASFDRLKRALGLAKGMPLSERMAWEPALSEQPLEGGDSDFLAGGLEGFAHEEEKREALVCDREGMQ